ncbi:Ras-related protein Rab-8B [Geodia barretti]|uniref:Ras-related protein Rab-8B n=1 Tax=Geodia barretti TaxID=519541 RepID=A0AA35SAL6_GEOBA|nr:Ras-related protein Rab-8B [Geodia barretti]
MAETFEALLKVVIIGDTAVGKTCLILRYTQDLFRENFLSTIGVDFKTKTVELNDKKYKLQVWDTAGQERYNTIRKGFYRGAKGVVIVYDITNPDSFSHISKWIHDISANCADGNDKPVLMILGNKCDLDDERRIHTETASQAAQEFDTIFAEVSARTGRGIDEAFDELVDRMVRLHEQRDSFNFTDSSIMLRDHTISAEPHGCKC